MTGRHMRIADYLKGLVQLRRVREKPSLIANFENPTEKMQLAAVKADPELILHLDNPTEKVQLLGVSKNPDLFPHLRHPTEKTCLMAVNSDPGLIRYIREPSERVQLAAVRQNASVIKYVENPAEKAQLAAVMANPELVRGMENPAERVQLAAIKDSPELIRAMENPTERVQLLATGSDPSLMQSVKNPSEKACMVLVSGNPDNIRYITAPSEKVQLMAVRDNPANILRIKNPSRNVCLSCLTAVLPTEGSIPSFRENLSEPVKNLFTRLDEIENRYEDLMREAGNMNTYKDRSEAMEEARAYRTRETSTATRTFRKEAAPDVSATPVQNTQAEKKAATTAQASPKELRFKGGRRELTVKDGKAILTVNGRNFDATKILTDMRAQGVDISKVPAKTMGEMLKGNRTALPGASKKSLFSIVKGAAGYGMAAFQAVQQTHGIASQEM